MKTTPRNKMRNLFIMSLVILSVVAYSESLGGGMRSGGWSGGSAGGGRGSKYASAPAKTYFGAGAGAPVGSNSNNTTGKPLSPSRRGLGISAWGIIAIIISTIMLVAGTYYFFIFYPLICKKERNYDVMELHQSPV